MKEEVTAETIRTHLADARAAGDSDAEVSHYDLDQAAYKLLHLIYQNSGDPAEWSTVLHEFIETRDLADRAKWQRWYA